MKLKQLPGSLLIKLKASQSSLTTACQMGRAAASRGDTNGAVEDTHRNVVLYSNEHQNRNEVLQLDSERDEGRNDGFYSKYRDTNEGGKSK